MITLLWNRWIAIVVGIVSTIALVFGWRHSIRKDAKTELSKELQDQAITAIMVSKEVEHEISQSDGDTIVERLRDNGWLRD